MLKRILIYILGTLILAFGLVLNSKTGLGVSPVLSTPFALSQITSLSFGTWTTIIYFIFVFIEIILYRKLDIFVLLQLPFSYIFGLLIDFYNSIIPISNPPIYIALVLILVAITCVAFGVVLMLCMELIMNPADGFNKCLSEVFHFDYGKVKLSCDISIVVIAVIIGLLVKHTLIGVGIGTLISALLTGPMIQFFNKHIGQKLTQITLESKGQ